MTWLVVGSLPIAAGQAFGSFDRAYVINRDRDGDRLAKMSARLGGIGVPFERFGALVARDDEPVFAGKPELTPGYFACARSHLAVLRSAMERGHERVIVLEDDAVFRDDTAERMARIVPQLQGMEWDVFYFGLHLLEAGGRVSQDLGIVKRSFHSHAYAVSRRAMPAMIEIIETAMREGFHYDCHEIAGKPPLLRVYADPILAVQEPNESGVLGEKVDRMDQYFPPFDREEFFAHCAEARGFPNISPSTGRCCNSEVDSNARIEGPDKPSAQRSGAPDSVREVAPVSEASEAPLRCAVGLWGGVTAAAESSVKSQPPVTQSPPISPPPVLRGRGTEEKPHTLLREAKRHHKVNRLAEAERLYRLALQRDGEDAEALYLLGVLEHQRGRAAAAVEQLGRAAGLRPENAEYRGKLGMALAGAGRLDEALAELDRAIELANGQLSVAGGPLQQRPGPVSRSPLPSPPPEYRGREETQAALVEAHYNRGVVLDRLGRGDEAIAAWERTIAVCPAHAEALGQIGRTMLTRQRWKEAREFLERAVGANPRSFSAHNGLGAALRQLGETARAAGHFRRATALSPGHAEAHNNLGIALYELGKPAEAVPHLEKALEIREDLVDAHWNLALCLLSLGDFQRGWLEHEWRRRLPADAAQQRAVPLPQPEWNGCGIEGRTVLVSSEQGLGDTLQFIRYVPLLLRRPSTGSTGSPQAGSTGSPQAGSTDSTSSPQAGSPQAGSTDSTSSPQAGSPQAGSTGSPQAGSGLCGAAKVIVECQPQLRELLATLEGAVQVVARGEPLPRFDTHVRLASLPGILGTRLGNVPADGPYLKADETRVEQWRKRLEVVEQQMNARAGGGTGGSQKKSRDSGEGESSAVAAADPHPNPLLFEPEPQSRRPEYRESGPEGDRARRPEASGVGSALSLGIFSAAGAPTGGFAAPSSVPPVRAPAALEKFPGSPRTISPSADESVRNADPTGVAAGPEGNTAARPFRIGIAWQGNPTFPNDRERSVPLLHFAPLAAVPGVRLFSLQKNHGTEQLAEAKKKFPILDFSPPLDDATGAFIDTAAVMANLDLVVTSDTSIVHLAGALGVRVWMATSFACDWRWLRDRDDSPWYPTLRLFRQPRRGDWPTIFNRMADALRDTLASPHERGSEHRPAAVPIAPGDLLDRLTILQIKSERLRTGESIVGANSAIE